MRGVDKVGEVLLVVVVDVDVSISSGKTFSFSATILEDGVGEGLGKSKSF